MRAQEPEQEHPQSESSFHRFQEHDDHEHNAEELLQPASYSTWNPSIGLVLDSLATASGSGSSQADGFELRSVEISFAHRIDQYGWAYIVAAIEDDELELEEAAVLMDELPGNFTLRAGKMLADFGKWNTIHLNEKNFVFEDGVRTAFFGGNLAGTGLELHQKSRLGPLPVRWSLGVHSSFGGESFESAVLADRGLQEFGFTGRMTTQQDFGHSGWLQYGASFFHTGKGFVEKVDTNADGIPDQDFGIGQTTLAVDFTFSDVQDNSHTANTLSLEVWRNQRDVIDLQQRAIGQNANGIWGFYQFDFNHQWAAGVQGAWWQNPQSTAASGWFSGADSGAQQAAFVTCTLSDHNRLRAQISQDHLPRIEPSWTFALQWDVSLGEHRHVLDW
ncbi:MAG: hypothetical protein COA70_11180 [Planctomycetota bacterium]|nr:MAG: hypothetical protein COA70_11180 [Planctomycetota bacterium]